MTTNQYINEDDAARLVSVSTRTLGRFTEAGYLTVDTSVPGVKRYLRRQLEEIFGAASVMEHQGDDEGDVNTADEPIEEPSSAFTHESNAVDQGYTAQGDEALSHSPHRREPFESEEGTEASAQDRSTGMAALELEIQRLRNLLSMQERILDAKDDEIADLRGQRTWLRERIEKLEEKADRDQILLLSETQTIRKLISIQENRKSPVKQLLQWIGLVPSSEPAALPTASEYPSKSSGSGSSRTIEVKAAANGD